MMKNYAVISKVTKMNGFVTKITDSRIYVDFINSPELSIGLELRKFKDLLIVDEKDMNEIEEIMLEKKLEKKK